MVALFILRRLGNINFLKHHDFLTNMISRITKYIIIKIFLAGVIIFNCSSSHALDIIEYSSSYANFIVSLVNNTEFSKKGTICTFGSDSVSKSILNQDNNFIELSSDIANKDLKKCKVVYVSKSMQKGLRSEMEKFNNNNVFTIAIFDNFVESGGMVQVILGRRNFELVVNHRNIKNSNVKLSALAVSLVIN